MFNEKERERVNRFLSNQTFDCSAPMLGLTNHDIGFEYRFEVVGERKMISVGEYYMYAEVSVEILKIEEKIKPLLKLMGEHFNNSEMSKSFFLEDWQFKHRLDDCIGENLKYVNNGDDIRITFNEIIMTDDLYDDIMSKHK